MTQLIFRTLYGSRLYGTDLPESDYDYKGVFLPSAEEILAGETKAHIELGKEDQAYSLKEYLRLLAEGQSVALEMYFAPPKAWTQCDPYWYDVQQIGSVLISRNVAAAVGYARAQASKYSVRGDRLLALEAVLQVLRRHEKGTDQLQDALFAGGFVISQLPENLRQHIRLVGSDKPPHQNFLEVCNKKMALNVHVNEAVRCWDGLLREYGERAHNAASAIGVDWKALYHAERIIGQTAELLQTGRITLPRTPPAANRLLAIRRGEHPAEAIFESIQQGFELIETLRKDCEVLPEEPDEEAAKRLIIKIHREIVEAA